MSAAPKDVGGLLQARNEALRRIPLRVRGGNVTLSGWRLDITSAQGVGAITQADETDHQVWLRGEGYLLGFPQERLKEIWAALTAHEETSAGDSGPQLG